jgi:hypothetical protein
MNQRRWNATMPRKEEATSLGAQHDQHPNTAQRLLQTAWNHCGEIQAIIDRLNEAGMNIESHLLANRLQRLVFRVRPVSSENRPT